MSGSSAPRLDWTGRVRRGIAPLDGAEPGRGLVWDVSPAWGLVAATLGLGVAGQGSAARLLFPLGAIMLGAWLLYSRRVGAYVVFTLWLFVLAPWLRRWLDLHFGWMQVNPIMMAPWLAGALSLTMLLPVLMAPRLRLSGGVLTIVLAGTFGLVVAALQGRGVAGLFDWLRYCVPPCFGILVLTHLPRHPSIVPRLMRFFAMVCAATGAYGVWQYVALPAWDASWMANSWYLDSIGEPEPYKVRVFSTLNSPQSYAAVLGVALVYLLAFPGVLSMAGLALGSAGLMLSLVRSTWVSLVPAVIYLLARGSHAAKAYATVLALAVVVALPSLPFVAPEATRALEKRIDTLASGEIGADTSFNDRMDQYQRLAELLDREPFGQGLAVSGSYQNYVDGQQALTIDGGLMEIFIALGIFAGTAYFLGVVYCLVAGIRAARAGCPVVVLASSAVALQALLVLPLTLPVVGEGGMFVWTAVALSQMPWVPARGASEMT